jgi:hypothetical protein
MGASHQKKLRISGRWRPASLRVSSLVMTAFDEFWKPLTNDEKRAETRFQGGSAGSNPVGDTSRNSL